MTQSDFPPLQPPLWLRNGHTQTLAGLWLPHRAAPYAAMQHAVLLDDGDQLILHDDRPVRWEPRDRTAVLIHGLVGSHLSPYLQRIASKLNARGVRTFRMDLRGCGAGAALARFPYHSGRSEDAAAALRFIGNLCAGSPTTLIGFSLGGNIVLKLAGESAERLPDNLDSVISVSPPIDLSHCVDSLRRPLNRIYDRYFVKLLMQQIKAQRTLVADAATVEFPRRPRGVREFDDIFTAPVCGFGTADNYYRRCSAAQFLSRIRIPVRILTAADDPMVPPRPFREAKPSPTVQLHISPRGGHLGFVNRRGIDPDCRWMDWRVVEWVESFPPATRNSKYSP